MEREEKKTGANVHHGELVDRLRPGDELPATPHAKPLLLEESVDDQHHRRFVQRMLATRKAEAVTWLRGGPAGSIRTLGEMATNEESVAYVHRLYEAGAVEVIAVKIYEYGPHQNTGHLLVRLPAPGILRERVFELERQQAESMGFEGARDNGQTYLYFKLD